MKYLVTLTPLEPYLFGGDTIFGTFGDEKNSSYLVYSRRFPQQSALLGMLKREIMTQAGLLTKKVRGEWVDQNNKNEAAKLVSKGKFNILSNEPEDLGAIKTLSCVFLLQNNKRFIKKVAIDNYPYSDGVLKGFDPKVDIYDNYICLDADETKKSSDIFEPIEQIGNSKFDDNDSLFKKTSYMLKDNFSFAFYLECDFELKDSIVALGADRSGFQLKIKEDSSSLSYEDKNGYLTLLGDSYITVPLKENCEFAITSELSYRQLTNKFDKNKRCFSKSSKIYLYEKGSVIINPSQNLLDNLNNQNLQQIGLNKYTYKGQNK